MSLVGCRGKNQLPSRWLTFFSAVKSSDSVFIRDSSTVHPLALLLLTDGDIVETVRGQRVEVSFPGRSLVRCELPVDSWELLWELRMSLQTMLHRNLSRPDGPRAGGRRGTDAQLIDLPGAAAEPRRRDAPVQGRARRGGRRQQRRGQSTDTNAAWLCY
ncbi:unnamed protein product [Gadus morhua 'NCC']